MATPTLALIPTGYKAGKLYSVLPESGVGDFTVVRATEATRVNEDGLIETMGANVPRLDYSGGGCPVLLTEPQRTNYVLLSNDYTSITGSGYVTPNYGTSPEGLSASRILFTGASQLVSAPTSLGTGVVCNFSAYVKGVQGELIRFAAGGVDISHTFSGEWERLSGSATSINSSWNVNTFGSATARDFLMCAAQLEQGSYPTSYIKTEGSAVTRNADQVTGAGDAATFNDSEGVLMLEASSTETTSVIWSVTDGSNSNAVSLYYGAQGVICDVFSSVGVRTLIATIPIGFRTNMNKFLVKYKSTDLAIWVNGFELAVSTQTISLSGLNELEASYGSGSFPFYGKTSQIQYFNTVLTDSELEKLTSWTSFIEMAQGQNYNII